MSRLGPTELLIILAIVLLLFGSTKLPSLARGLGDSIREFKKSARDEANEAPAPKDETGNKGA